jgi:hypothetical protein
MVEQELPNQRSIANKRSNPEISVEFWAMRLSGYAS